MDKVLNVSEVGRWFVAKCLRAWKFCDSGLFVQQQSCLNIVLQLSQHFERLKQYKHLIDYSSAGTIKNIENTSGGGCH
jgi:nuclear transport factor 2 (NTF2) superfamily protein